MPNWACGKCISNQKEMHFKPLLTASNEFLGQQSIFPIFWHLASNNNRESKTTIKLLYDSLKKNNAFQHINLNFLSTPLVYTVYKV